MNLTIQDIGNSLQERGEVAKVIMLAMLSNNNCSLLGKPGTAKSYLVRCICKHIEGIKFFDYLFNSFSTLDEVCGIPSLQAMRDRDSFERNFSNTACDAHVFFGDELPRGNSAILNAILTIINEHKFSGRDVPMKLCVSAQNSYLDDDENFNALDDRFLLRAIVEPITKDENFLDFLNNAANPQKRDYTVNPLHKFSLQEWDVACEEVSRIKVSPNILKELLLLRKAVSARDIYISDRRWAQIIRVLQAEAFLNNRVEVIIDDLQCLKHCLWKKEEDRETIFALLRTLDSEECIKIVKESDTILREVAAWKALPVGRPRNDQASRVVGNVESAKEAIQILMKKSPRAEQKGKVAIAAIEAAYKDLRNCLSGMLAR